MIITLKGRTIPRNANGDPAFTWLNSVHRIAVVECNAKEEDLHETSNAAHGDEVNSVFTCAEIVALVNRALYQLEYSAQAHRKYGAAKRAVLTPLKRKVRAMFAVPFDKATPAQVQRAQEELRKLEGGGEK